MCAYAVIYKNNTRRAIRRQSLDQLVKVVGHIVQCVRVSRLFVWPTFARVARGSTLSIAVVREYPWLRGETRLLKNIYGRFPTRLWESEAIEEDNEKTACGISLKELIRNRRVWF
jgi:hypothetical protein